jgi:hypothetical protein
MRYLVLSCYWTYSTLLLSRVSHLLPLPHRICCILVSNGEADGQTEKQALRDSLEGDSSIITITRGNALLP